MSTKKVANHFRHLAGMDPLEEAIPPMSSPTDRPSISVPPAGQSPVEDQKTLNNTSVSVPTQQPAEDEEKKFWLVLPASGSSTIDDVLSHVTMKELCDTIRGGSEEDDDQLMLFTDDQEDEAYEAAHERLGSGMQQPGEEVPASASVSPVAPTPPMGESAKQKIEQLDLTNKDGKAITDQEIKAPAEPKVKVPGEVTSALKAAKQQAAKDLERVQKRGTRDSRSGDSRPADIDFYVDLMNAYDKIDGLLKDGTEESIKQLQMFIPSLQNWVTKEFPPVLIKFVAKGGKTASLKDRFQEIKAYKTQ